VWASVAMPSEKRARGRDTLQNESGLA
jgi:hypothetical protein